MNRLFIVLLSLLCMGLTVFLHSCIPGTTGPFGITLTDAPIDDPLYPQVFVTISEIQLDGKALEAFGNPTTIELSALQNGATVDLLEADLPIGDYQSLTLVLNYDQDENGETPGCYAMTTYGRKINLANGQGGKIELALQQEISIVEDQERDMVLDFDLRKSIRAGLPGDEGELNFIDPSHMTQALRLVDAPTAGNVKGSLTLSSSLPEINPVIVYAYPRGSFERSQEEWDPDGDGITYEGAITSSKAILVNNEYSFTLSFLPPGEYDLVFLAYNTIDFFVDFKGYLRSPQAAPETFLHPITVTAGQDNPVSFTLDQLIE